MPLTIQNIAAELEARITRTLNMNLDDQFYRHAIADADAFRVRREGSTLVSFPRLTNDPLHPVGLFTITFDTPAIPSRQYLEANDGVNIRRVTLHFNGDRAILPPRTRTKFYFIQRQNTMAIESRKVAEKLVELNTLYRQGMLKMIAKKEQEAKDAKTQLTAEEQLIERKKKLKATEAQRESMYEELQASLAGFGTVESEVKAGYMNLKLENNVRVKIAVDADRVFITEIDTPIYFDRSNLKSVLGYLQKVSAL
jgi:hypothetical protein